MFELYDATIIKEKRREKKWTQKQVCEMTGLSKNQVIAIEKGRFSGGIKYLRKYLEILDLQMTIEVKRYDFPQLHELHDMFNDD